MQTKTKGRVALAAFSLIGLLITGCASNRPLITEDKLGRSGVRTVASSAESRLVMVKSNEPDLRWWRVLFCKKCCVPQIEAKICAEPPPDVAQRIFEKLNLEAKGNVTNGPLAASAEMVLARQMARDIAQLSKRSQGVILFRDFSFRISEAYFNGAIDSDDLKSSLNNAFTQASALVEKELKGNPTLSSTSNQGDFIELMAAATKDLKDEIIKYHKQANADGTTKIESLVKEQTGKDWADFVKDDEICSDKLRMALAKIKESK